MRTSPTFFLLIIVTVLSCSKASEGPSNLEQTLRLTNESLRKTVDLQLNTAIWTDEQRGRENEVLVAKLKELAASRKNLNHTDLSSIQAHVSILSALTKEIKEDLDLDLSFARVDEYMTRGDQNSQTQQLLIAELSAIELALVEYWSRELGIVDCCFPSPMSVQTNEAIAGKLYEMVIFPNGDRSLWDQASYTYENIHLTQAGREVPIDIMTNQIGHVMMVQFTVKETGEYLLHFSVTESGDYIAETWQQDFKWPVVFQ